jgi:hypothetical protein
MNLNLKKPLPQAKAFLKEEIWKATLMMMMISEMMNETHFKIDLKCFKTF